MYSQYHCTLNVWCSTISLVINNSLVENLELVISNDDNNSSKELKSFQWQWHCQQICSKVTSLSSARQIYHWPTHNSAYLEFAYSILLIPPFHKYVTVWKCNVLFSLMSNNSSMNRISMLDFLPDVKIPVLHISVFSAESGQTSYRKVPCFTNKVLEWYKHVFQIHNFPWWQDQSYSSANYIHCSAKLSVTVHNFTIHCNSQFPCVQLTSVVELSVFCWGSSLE